MNKLLTLCAVLMAPSVVWGQSLAGANGERSGITAAARHVFDDATIPGKEFRVLHTTYAPGGQNPKHYHPSHVVFYVLEGSGVWQEEGKDAVTLKPGERALDIAGGTGDLSEAFARKVGPSGRVVHTDINEAMLRTGRDRLVDAGLMLPTLVCDAERLPFPDASFDRVSVAFGLRNMTHKDAALREMRRVLKPGGKLLVLEFSKVAAPLQKPYDIYSFKVLPWLGQKIANDADSYRYLAESIRMHPDQETLKGMMQDAGLDRVDYFNLTGGVAALHVGVKL